MILVPTKSIYKKYEKEIESAFKTVCEKMQREYKNQFEYDITGFNSITVNNKKYEFTVGGVIQFTSSNDDFVQYDDYTKKIFSKPEYEDIVDFPHILNNDFEYLLECLIKIVLSNNLVELK